MHDSLVPWVESCVIPQTGVTPEVGVTWRVALQTVAAQHERRVASGGERAGRHPWCVQRGVRRGAGHRPPCTHYARPSESPGPIKFTANMMPARRSATPG